MPSSAPSRRWPRPAARAGASSSTASATPASWRRTRSTSSSAWASTAAAISDGHVQVMSATMLKPGDCAVIISNSGRSRDLLDVAEIARARAPPSSSSPPAARRWRCRRRRPNHILLAADHPEDYDRYSPMVSRLLHLLIIDILTTGVALRLGSGELRPLLQEIKKNLRAQALRRIAIAAQAGWASPSSSATPYSCASCVSLGGAPCTSKPRPAAWASRSRLQQQRQRGGVEGRQRRRVDGQRALAAVLHRRAACPAPPRHCRASGVGGSFMSALRPRPCCARPAWRSGRRCRRR